MPAISSVDGNGLSRPKATARSTALAASASISRERFGGEPALLPAVALEAQDGILLLPVGGGERLAILAGVALVVAAQAVREALQQERPASGARRVEVGREGVAHGRDVVAVDGLALQLVGSDDVAHALDVGVRRARRELREAVVLAHQDERQLPQRGEVDGLVEVPGLHGAVAEEHDRHGVLAAQPHRQRAPEGDRDAAADHAGGAHEAVLDVDQVHRAAEPAAEAGVAAHQLGHHALQRRALGDRMPVRPVPGVDRRRRRAAASRSPRPRLPGPRSGGSGRGLHRPA